MRRLLFLALLAAFFGGCAGYRDTSKQRMEAMTQHYSQFDLLIGWDTKVVGDKTVIEGVAKNVRYTTMYDLEIWVAVLDEAGKEKSRSVSFVIPRQLGLDESAGFTVKLPAVVPPGTRLRFTYRYRGSEGDEGFGGGMERGPNWMQSFEATVPAR